MYFKVNKAILVTKRLELKTIVVLYCAAGKVYYRTLINHFKLKITDNYKINNKSKQ